MKKINFFLLLALLLCQSGFNSLMAQASVVTPVSGEQYSIAQATGLFLTRNINADNPKVQNPSGNYDQVFVFEAVPDEDGTYYIKNAFDDDYLVRLSGQNAWTMGWTKDPRTIANVADGKFQISILEATTDYIQIKNLGSGSMLGSDAATDGSTVYGNKNGLTEVKYQWKIKVWTDEVDKTALQNKLTEAQTLYNSTSEGTGSDQYPANTRNALKVAIDYAQELIDDNQASQEDVNGALLDLTEALTAYINSVYPYLPDVTKTYYIKHSSDLFFTSVATIAAGDYTANQQFQFVAVAGQTAIYNIKSVGTGKYLTRDVGPAGGTFTYWWGIIWGDDPTSQYAKFEIKSTGTGFYTVRCTGQVLDGSGIQRNSSLGTDANDAGAGVYLDKNGMDGKHYWKFQDISAVPVVKTALEESIAKAADFLTYAVKGNGSDEYSATEYDALTAAKAIADAVVANENATQQEVSDATLALNDALAATIAAVNPFLPDVSKTYNIVHHSGLYFGEYSDDTNTNAPAIFTNAQTTTQKFQFVAVPDNAGVYNIKVVSLDKYLTRESAPNGQTDNNGNPKYDDYKLLWGEDPTTDFAKFIIKKAGVQNWHTIQCITPGPERPNSFVGTDATDDFTGVYVDKNGKNTNHYWNVQSSDGSGIGKVDSGYKPYVSTGSKKITISDLQGINKINIYFVTGQLISSSQVSATAYTKVLPSGSYIVVVNGDSPYRGIAVVK